MRGIQSTTSRYRFSHCRHVCTNFAMPADEPEIGGEITEEIADRMPFRGANATEDTVGGLHTAPIQTLMAWMTVSNRSSPGKSLSPQQRLLAQMAERQLQSSSIMLGTRRRGSRRVSRFAAKSRLGF